MTPLDRLRKITASHPYLFFVVILFPIILFFTVPQPVPQGRAQNRGSSALLFPAGGGYTGIFPAFSSGAIASTQNNIIKILVLPITLASNPDQISDIERQQALYTAENLRAMIESACQLAAGVNFICQVTSAPILTRSDATNKRNLEYFNNQLSAIFIPDGNPGVAMEVIGGTLVEGALVRAHQEGTMVAGTGAGGTIQSSAMINGYNPGYSSANALNFNAVDVWANAEQHGLLFGIQNAMIDTDFHQSGYAGRLLNAISLAGDPQVGIGIDNGTSVDSPDGQTLENVSGSSGIMILDAETYHAAQGARYRGCGNVGVAVLPCTPLLSLRNVLVHLLAPGDFRYDLNSRQFSLNASPDSIQRNFDAFRLPPEAGTLILSGSLDKDRLDRLALEKFTEASNGPDGRRLIISVGFLNTSQAQEAGQKLADSLGAAADVLVLPVGSTLDPNVASTYNGIAVTSSDPAEISADALQPIYALWRNGIPLLLDDAAALLAGKFYASSPVPQDGEPITGLSASRNFLRGQVHVSPGLGMLPIGVETRLMSGNRWGRLFSIAYEHPDLLAVGLNTNTSLIINNQGAVLQGENVALVLDLSNATLAQGENLAFVIANGLVDVFTPGENLIAEPADIALLPDLAATPVLVSPTATPLPTATTTVTPTPTSPPTKTPKPTHGPRPTATPPIIPPPSNPNISQWLAVFGALIVVVILIGLLLNRHKLR